MKRSEMLERLAHAIEYHEWKGEPDEMADHILTFIEKQGMQPPPYTPKNLEGDKVQFPVSYNEWEDEE